jgi:hypothetical protein
LLSKHRESASRTDVRVKERSVDDRYDRCGGRLG